MKTKKTSSAAAIAIINQNLISDASEVFEKIKKSFAFFSTTRIASFDSAEIKAKISNFFSKFSPNGSKINGNKIKKFIPLSILALVLVVILFQAKNVVMSAFGKPTDSDSRVTISGPIASQQINKLLEIPIKDNTGKEATKIKYLLQSAELRNEIIVKGERMVAVKGRTFLILNIKLTNDYNKQIDVNARDDVRITIPGNSDKIAADIHNDPVSIQPVSTKMTRLGFPIDDNKKTITLLLGQIDGPKQTISLKF